MNPRRQQLRLRRRPSPRRFRPRWAGCRSPSSKTGASRGSRSGVLRPDLSGRIPASATRAGRLVYALPQTEAGGWTLVEEVVGDAASQRRPDRRDHQVSYFHGNDPAQWQLCCDLPQRGVGRAVAGDTRLGAGARQAGGEAVHPQLGSALTPFNAGCAGRRTWRSLKMDRYRSRREGVRCASRPPSPGRTSPENTARSRWRVSGWRTTATALPWAITTLSASGHRSAVAVHLSRG